MLWPLHVYETWVTAEPTYKSGRLVPTAQPPRSPRLHHRCTASCTVGRLVWSHNRPVQPLNPYCGDGEACMGLTSDTGHYVSAERAANGEVWKKLFFTFISVHWYHYCILKNGLMHTYNIHITLLALCWQWRTVTSVMDSGKRGIRLKCGREMHYHVSEGKSECLRKKLFAMNYYLPIYTYIYISVKSINL